MGNWGRDAGILPGMPSRQGRSGDGTTSSPLPHPAARCTAWHACRPERGRHARRLTPATRRSIPSTSILSASTPSASIPSARSQPDAGCRRPPRPQAGQPRGASGTSPGDPRPLPRDADRTCRRGPLSRLSCATRCPVQPWHPAPHSHCSQRPPAEPQAKACSGACSRAWFKTQFRTRFRARSRTRLREGAMTMSFAPSIGIGAALRRRMATSLRSSAQHAVPAPKPAQAQSLARSFARAKDADLPEGSQVARPAPACSEACRAPRKQAVPLTGRPASRPSC